MVARRFLHLQVAGADYLINAAELDDVVFDDGALLVHYRSGRTLTIPRVPKEAAMRVLHYFTNL